NLAKREQRVVYRNLQKSLNIFETTLLCTSKWAVTNGQDIHTSETRGRGNYRTSKQITVVYERLALQTASQAFYVTEFLTFDWEITQSGDCLGALGGKLANGWMECDPDVEECSKF
ncbi:hypothetical protein J6590_084694, partial [Homalodisca vitripennis]